MIKSVKVTNYLGESIILELGAPEKSGLLVREITGLGPSVATINTTEMSTNDGSIYNSGRVNQRNIVLSLNFMWHPSIERSRHISYKYFPIKKPVKLVFMTDTRQSEIVGYVESNSPSIFSKMSGTQISIICPDPYFYSTSKQTTVFSGVISQFTFPFSNELIPVSTGQSISLDSLVEGDKLSKLTLHGKTLETGTGIKTPDNPYTITSVGEGGFIPIVISDGTNSQTVDIPINEPLYRHPKIMQDEYDITSGKIVRRQRKVILTGNETWHFAGSPTTNVARFNTDPMVDAYDYAEIMFDKLPFEMSTADYEHGLIHHTEKFISVFILKSRMPGWDDAWTYTQKINALKTWLADNPITAIYELAEPVTTEVAPISIPLYTPTSIITTTDTVQPEMVCKIFDDRLILGEIELLSEKTIFYAGDSNTGIIIKMHAVGLVQNLTIYNTGSREIMFIDTDKLTLITGSPIIAGDDITISTIQGNKYIHLLRDGENINILNCLGQNSSWLALTRGDNVFTYSAEVGSENLQFLIENSTKYEGV